MTQAQILLQIIKDKGSVIPSQMCGRVYNGVMCGSDFPRRARALRKQGILRSEKEGKFERFFLVAVPMKVYRVVGERGETLKTINLPI